MMAERVKIVRAFKHGLFAVAAERADTRRIVVHRHRFRKDDPRARTLLDAVRAACEIDLAHWRAPNANGW